MPITDIVKEVDLTFVGEKCCSDRMDWCVSPSFIVETSLLIQMIKEVHVCLRTPEGERSDLEIGPDWSSQRDAIKEVSILVTCTYNDTCCRSLLHHRSKTA